ncbi:hypothetical protein ABID95_001798 [Streptomyces atratus]
MHGPGCTATPAASRLSTGVRPPALTTSTPDTRPSRRSSGDGPGSRKTDSRKPPPCGGGFLLLQVRRTSRCRSRTRNLKRSRESPCGRRSHASASWRAPHTTWSGDTRPEARRPRACAAAASGPGRLLREPVKVLLQEALGGPQGSDERDVLGGRLLRAGVPFSLMKALNSSACVRFFGAGAFSFLAGAAGLSRAWHPPPHRPEHRSRTGGTRTVSRFPCGQAGRSARDRGPPLGQG